MAKAKIFCIFIVSFGIAVATESIQTNYDIKCQFGSYYNDGCTECICNTLTGETECDKSQCPEHPRTCPDGEVFKDSNGNHCKCYEDTGAIFCSIVTFQKNNEVQSSISRRSGADLQKFEDDITTDQVVASDTLNPVVLYVTERQTSDPKEKVEYVDLIDSQEVGRATQIMLHEEKDPKKPWNRRSEHILFTPYKSKVDQLMVAYRQRRTAEKF